MTCHITSAGTAERLEAPKALKEKGSAISAEKRNIHFMNVTTEYFWISGLNTPT